MAPPCSPWALEPRDSYLFGLQQVIKAHRCSRCHDTRLSLPRQTDINQISAHSGWYILSWLLAWLHQVVLLKVWTKITGAEWTCSLIAFTLKTFDEVQYDLILVASSIRIGKAILDTTLLAKCRIAMTTIPLCSGTGWISMVWLQLLYPHCDWKPTHC